MEELLKFVENKLKEVKARKTYTYDEDGNELDCDFYDGEGIFEDGFTEGLSNAYKTMELEIKKRMEEENQDDHMA